MGRFGFGAVAAGLLAAVPLAHAGESAPAAPLAARIAAAGAAPIGEGEAALAAARALAAEALADPVLAPDVRARAQLQLAEVLHAADRIDEARMALDRAGALAAGGTVPGELAGNLLSLRAKLEFAANKGQQALAAAQEAEAVLATACPAGCDLRADNWGNIGRAQYRLGNSEAAEQAYRRANAGGALAGRRAREYPANLMGLAQVLSHRGDEDDSIATYYRAREAARTALAADDSGQGMILSELAVHLANAYRLEEAVPQARAAAEFFRATAGATSFDHGAALKNLGYVLLKAGEVAEARAALAEALRIFADPSVRVRQIGVQADALQLAGMAAREANDFKASVAALERGLELLERGRRLPLLAGDIAYQLGETRAAAQDWQGAEAALALVPASDATRTPAYSFFEVRRKLLHALVAVRLGRAEAGWSEAQGVARLMVSRLTDPRLSAGARQTMQAVYRWAFARYVEIAVATGHLAEGFEGAQWGALTELAVSGQRLAAARAAVSPQAAALVQALGLAQNALARLERDANLAQARGSAEVFASRIETAQASVDAAIAALRRVDPDYFALLLPRASEAGAVRRALAPGRAVILPVVSGDALIVLAATRGQLVASSTRFAPGELGANIRSLRASVEDPGAQFDRAAAWALGRALFAPPVVKALANVREVDLVGAGPLMTIPPGLLLTAPPSRRALRAQPYAIRRFAFAVRPLLDLAPRAAAMPGSAFLGVGAPRLGAGAGLTRAGRAPGAAMLMRGGVGDPTSLRQLPSLPATAGELRAIARAIPAAGNRVLTGAAATEAAVRGLPLDHYGVIAFATHGLVSGELRGLSEPALVLTPPDGAAPRADNDGLLTASEAAALHLRARWVILSACNTGASADNGAGGTSALARGFLEAGAESLLVSAWPLRDDAAARLTVDAVRFQASGLSEAEALRRAALRLMADRRLPDAGNPAIWAPFTLVRR